METLELEQVLDDMRMVTNCLTQLRHMDCAAMYTLKNIAAYQ